MKKNSGNQVNKKVKINLSDCLVIGISSRALFDLEEANEVFESSGVDAYRQYQLEREDEILRHGTAFHLVEALLRLNRYSPDKRLVEVIVLSRNSPDTGLRIFNSIKHYNLDISRAAFTGGESLTPYANAFSVDLFLSKSENDVQSSIDTGIAAALLYAPPQDFDPDQDAIRIAFDADSVLFSEDSELIYREEGLEAFEDHEVRHAQTPLREGPFAKLLKTLAYLQTAVKIEDRPVRLAIVTARNSPAHERVIQTLREWNVFVDEAFFLGGLPKDQVLGAFRAHIFFDDQETHLAPASRVVPTGRVPYKSGSPLKQPSEGTTGSASTNGPRAPNKSAAVSKTVKV